MFAKSVKQTDDHHKSRAILNRLMIVNQTELDEALYFDRIMNNVVVVTQGHSMCFVVMRLTFFKII